MDWKRIEIGTWDLLQTLGHLGRPVPQNARLEIDSALAAQVFPESLRSSLDVQAGSKSFDTSDALGDTSLPRHN